MSERKNIDRLFQEKFKDFEVNPPEAAWANIEAKLDEKKKKRVIPFWWKLSGVAAVFLIGFLIAKSVYSPEIKPGNTVVHQNNSDTTNGTNTEVTNKNGLKDNGQIKSDNAVVNEDNSNKASTSASETNEKGLKNSNKIRTEDAVVNSTNPNKAEKANPKKGLRNNGSDLDSDAVVSTSDKVKNNNASDRKNEITKAVNSSETSVVERKTSNQRSLKNKSNAEKNKAVPTESAFEKSQNQVAQNSKGKENNNTRGKAEQSVAKSTAEKDLVQTTIETKSKTSADNKNINLDALKGDTNSKIVTQETVKKVNDTAAKNGVVSNALEELLNEKESKLKQESKRARWQLTSNVAPVFLGSVAKGSPIDSTFSKNSKSYNTNVGFGIGVSYAVNKKLSVRTGLNKVNMSYNTNDIQFFTGIDSKTLKNVTPTSSSAMIHVQSLNTNSSSIPSQEAGLLPFENALVNKNDGYLKQEMGYLEMPVEMTYNLLDKKFGIKIIGGFSTLFLQDNSITIISEGRDTVLGEANNLSNVHFSTNLGLGVKYSFLKSFEFNIEPTVKYQLNTFSDNAGNFKPYLFGIYSGVSYKF